MSKTIKKGDIVHAAMDAALSDELMKLFEKAPMLMLLVPVIAGEIEKIIFSEETKEEK